MIKWLIKKIICRIRDMVSCSPIINHNIAYLKDLLNWSEPTPTHNTLCTTFLLCVCQGAAHEARSGCVVHFPYWKWELYLPPFSCKIPVHVLLLCLMQNDGTCQTVRVALLSFCWWPYRARDGSSSSVRFQGKLKVLWGCMCY